jgi:predicted outer membrane repeat protein
LNVSNCIFKDSSNNVISSSTRKSVTYIDNSTFSSNSASKGGAISVVGGNLTITNSIFNNNHATTAGAIYVNDAYLTIDNTLFDSNYADFYVEKTPFRVGAKATYLRRQRDSDLFEAYVSALRTHTFTSQMEAIDFVRQNKAPKFYISPEFCAIIMGRMQDGRQTGIKGRYQKMKFLELYSRFEKMPRDNDESILSRCEILIEQEAPCFYISLRSARDIITRERTRRRESMANRWAK